MDQTRIFNNYIPNPLLNQYQTGYNMNNCGFAQMNQNNQMMNMMNMMNLMNLMNMVNQMNQIIQPQNQEIIYMIFILGI